MTLRSSPIIRLFLFCIVTGVLVVSANMLPTESLTGLDVSFGFIIYCLKTICVLAMSYLLLAESLGL